MERRKRRYLAWAQICHSIFLAFRKAGFFQGAPDPGWNDSDLDQLKAISGTAFEIVDTGPVQTG